MKKSDITPEIIEKSKEFAKYGEPELYVGCWIWEERTGLSLISDNPQNYLNPNNIPIPSISDCLEKLRELSISIHLSDTARVNIEDVEYFNGSYVVRGINFKKYWFLNNPHEALLSALLEVLT